MSLKRYDRYPGRWESPSLDYPMGKFKNYTDEQSADGSYIERDWANDWDGYFGAVMSKAGIVPNGSVDTAVSSQYFDAAQQVFNAKATLVNSTGVTGKLGTFVFTQHGEVTLPVLPDGSMIRTSASYDVDLATGDCIIKAPSGETIRYKGSTDASSRIKTKGVFFTFIRTNGQWSV